MGSLGLTPSQSELSELQKKHCASGQLTLDAFCALMSTQKTPDADDFLDAFRRFDKNDDGVISIDELKVGPRKCINASIAYLYMFFYKVTAPTKGRHNYYCVCFSLT